MSKYKGYTFKKQILKGSEECDNKQEMGDWAQSQLIKFKMGQVEPKTVDGWTVWNNNGIEIKVNYEV